MWNAACQTLVVSDGSHLSHFDRSGVVSVCRVSIRRKMPLKETGFLQILEERFPLPGLSLPDRQAGRTPTGVHGAAWCAPPLLQTPRHDGAVMVSPFPQGHPGPSEQLGEVRGLSALGLGRALSDPRAGHAAGHREGAMSFLLAEPQLPHRGPRAACLGGPVWAWHLGRRRQRGGCVTAPGSELCWPLAGGASQEPTSVTHCLSALAHCSLEVMGLTLRWPGLHLLT